MLRRITLLAPAPTDSQRRAKFPSDDDTIEAVLPADLTAVLDALSTTRAVIGGPERRVTETAAALGLTVTVSTELAAWPSGPWAGRSIEEVATDEALAFAAWRTDPDAGAPGGESFVELLDRAAGWLSGTVEGSTAVIADATVIRAIAVHVLQATVESFWRMDVEPLSVTRVQSDGTTWRLRSLGAPYRQRALVNRD